MDVARLWKQFNLSPDDAAAVYCVQHGKCAICKREIATDSPATCGDHNHKDGTFRAWLCFLCNRALGLFGDDIERLRAAVVYLENPPATVVIPARFGTIGRKAGSVPKKRKQFFRNRFQRCDVVCTVYKCECSDSGPRAPKVCPVHRQPKI